MKFRLVLALVACGLVACGDDDVEPPAELVEFQPAIEINTVWKQRVGKGTERLRLGLAPATDATRIYAGAYDGTAIAIDMVSGVPVWEVDTGLKLSAGPGVGGGMVVFGATDGVLIALDADTGKELWQHKATSEVIAAPAVNDEIVAYRSTDGSLTALRPSDGDERWSIIQTLPLLTLRGNSPPLIVGDYVIAGFDNGRIGAYSIDEGVSRWEYPIGSPSGRSEIERLVDIGMDIEAFGNVVYAASFQGRAAAIFLTTGDRFWERDFSSFIGLGVDNEHAYISDDASAVIALDRTTGQEVWRQRALRLRDITAAARHRETVVVADFEGYVHWLSAEDGSFLARERASSAQITAQPLSVGPLLFVQAEDGTVTAFEIDDGLADVPADDSE